jgi:hypothetical protein
MSKQFKLMFLVNVVLGLLFAYSNYYIWNVLNNIRGLSFGYTNWSALLIQVDTGMGFLTPIINFPFIIFWVLLITNLYFIYRLERSKEAKQTPS